jgi:hypothetical protein
MDRWYEVLTNCESSLTSVHVDHARENVASLDVTIDDARRTLLRCLTSDHEVAEVTRAITAVKVKVARKERVTRNERYMKDVTANRDRKNKRLGIAKEANTLPSGKNFRVRGQPNQGRPQAQSVKPKQMQRVANKGHFYGRPPQEVPADERYPRQRQRQPNQNANPRSQYRNPQAPKPEVTIAYLMKELKKLKMRK